MQTEPLFTQAALVIPQSHLEFAYALAKTQFTQDVRQTESLLDGPIQKLSIKERPTQIAGNPSATHYLKRQGHDW